MRVIDTVEALSALYSAPAGASLAKVAPRLTPLYRAWIDGSRFCILSTAGSDGVHGSPRGDDGPVVQIADDRTILMPDWRGNNRLDCLRDIVEDGRVALLFLVAGSKTTVRVNGRAMLTDDLALRERFARGSTLPTTVIVITLREVYSQCAKALMRSGLWSRDDGDTVPTVGQILAEVSEGAHGGAAYDEGYEASARSRMW